MRAIRTRPRIRPVVLILAVALVLRVSFLAVVHPWSYPVEQQLTFNDSPLYHQLACTLLDHHRFAAGATDAPDPIRTPGYPLFVAGIYALFGEIPWIVFVAQIVMDCLSCYLLFLVLRRVLSETVASIGAFLYAIDPFLILYASTFLSETLFLLVLTIALHTYGTILSHGRNTNMRWRYGLLGLTVGVAALVRPIALYIPVVLIAFTLVTDRKKLARALVNSAILVAAFAVIVSPWLIRNYVTFGRASLSCADSWTLLRWNVGVVEAAKRHQDFEMTRDELLAEADSLMSADGLRPENLNPMEKADYWRRLAFRYILHDPIHFAMAHVKGTVFLFVNLGTSDFAHALHLPSHGMDMSKSSVTMLREFSAKKSPTEILIGAIVAPFLLITYLALVLGLFVAWRRFDRTFLAFCLLMALYFTMLPGAVGIVRYKLPAVPFYLCFVGIGIAHFLDRWRVKRAAAIASQQPNVII